MAKIDKDTKALQKQMASQARTETGNAMTPVDAATTAKNRAMADPLVRAMELLFEQGKLPKEAAAEFRAGKMTRERAYEVWRGLAYATVDKAKSDFSANLQKSLDRSS